MSDPAPTPIVVVLGAAYSGIPLAHRLIRGLPADYKVILVNPSTHLYWNFAAPRVLTKDNQFSPGNADVFQPILPGFSAHPLTRFEFIQGSATRVDPAANTVVVTTASDDDKPIEEKSITYTHLVVATGSSAHDDWPFKSVGTRTATEAAIKDVQIKIEAAKTIVLSGAGATGVETAGEIANLYKGAGKKIYILSSNDRLLPTVRADVGKAAQSQLEALGVIVKLNTRVTEVKEGGPDGAYELVLSGGETIAADLHIPTYGLVPNTGFLPAELLDDTKSVRVNAYMQSSAQPNIWATGDAAGVVVKMNLTTKPMLVVVEHNILAVAGGKGVEAFTDYKEPSTPFIVPIGGAFASGTGLLGGFKVWGVLVWLIKGRNFFVSKAPAVASGKNFSAGGSV